MKKITLSILCCILTWQLQAQKGYQGFRFEGHLSLTKPKVSFIDKTTNTTVEGSTDQSIGAGISFFMMRPFKNSLHYILEVGFTIVNSHDVSVANESFVYKPANGDLRLFLAKTFVGNIFTVYGGGMVGYKNGSDGSISGYDVTKKASFFNASVAGGAQVIVNGFVFGARITRQMTPNNIILTRAGNSSQQIVFKDNPTYFTVSLGKIFRSSRNTRIMN
jgi:hypothetical protein